MDDNFSIELGVELKQDALENVKKQINGVQPKPIDLKMNTDKVEKQLDSIKKQIESLNKITINLGGSGKNSQKASALQSAYRELYNMSKQISDMELKIGRLNLSGLDSTKISAYTTELNKLKTTYSTLLSSLGNNNVNFKTVFSQIDKSKTSISHLSSVLDDAKKKLATGIKIDIDNKTLLNEVASVEHSFNKLNVSSKEVSDNIKTLKSLLGNMKKSDNVDSLISDYQLFTQTLNKTKNSVSELNREQSIIVSGNRLSNSKMLFSSQIDAWLKDNSAAAKQFGAEIELLKSRIDSADNLTLNNLKAQFKEITQQAKIAGETGLTLSDRLKNQFSKLGVYFSATMVIMQTINSVKTGIDTVTGLDNALVDLKKTAKASAEELNNFYFEANDVAKKYGTTTKSIIQSAADWSRLGYSLNESKLMSQYSSMFSSISPDMDIDTATTGLVSVMKAYGIEAEDVLDGVMSKINAVGNSAATSNIEIIEGLKRASASMAVMGNSFEETVALFTAGQEITQDANKLGNALRSIAMRTRGYDEETEELSDDLVNINGEVIDLTKTVNNVKGVSLFTDETQTEYKSTYKYLKNISEIFDELGAKQQQELLEKLFGKNRASVGAAIIKNFAAAEKAMDTMAHSAGSAEREMDTITESLTYKLNALKVTGEGIAQNLFQREDMAVVIDTLTSLAGILDFATEKLGLFKTVAIGVAAGLSFKNIGIFKTIEDDAKLSGLRMTSIFVDAFNAIKTASSGITFSTDFESTLQSDIIALQNFESAVKNKMSVEEAISSTLADASTEAKIYAESVDIADFSTKKFEVSQRLLQVSLSAQNKSLVNVGSLIKEYNNKCINVGSSQSDFVDAIRQSNTGLAKYLSGLNGTNGSLMGYVISLIKAKTATLAVETATMALNMAITWGLSLAIQGLISVVYGWITASKEAEQAAIDAGHAAVDTGNDIYDSVQKYLDLSNSIDDSTTSSDEFSKAQGDVLRALGLAGEGIDTLIEKYGSLKNAILETSKEQLGTSISLALEGVTSGQKDAVDKLVTLLGGNSSISVGKDSVNALADLLHNGIAKYGSYSEGGGYISLPHNTTWDMFSSQSFEDMVENYQYLKDMMNYLSNGYSDTELFSKVTQLYGTYEEALQSVIDDIDNANTLIANSLIIDTDTSSVDSLEDYITVREKLISQLENNSNFQKNGNSSASGIIDTLLSESDALHGFSIEYQKYLESLDGLDNTVLSISDKSEAIRKKARESLVDTSSDIAKELSRLSEGGNVDLTIRPVIDSSILKKSGWSGVGNGISTVFTSTFSNENGNVAMNFTPILTDENGKCTGVLSPEELTRYAESVVAGTNEDNLNLKIGATFTGDDAIDRACDEAERIHELHEDFYNEYGDFEKWFLKLDASEINSLYNMIGDEFDLEELKNKINHPVFSFADLMAEEDTDEEKSFSSRVNEYVKNVTKLQKALEEIDNGKFSDSDVYELMNEFPELAGKSDDLSSAITELIKSLTGGEDELDDFSGIYADFQEQFGRLDADEDIDKLDDFMQTVLKLGRVVGKTDFAIDINAETKSMESFWGSVKESISSIGLSADAVKNLKERYKDLESYNPSHLFEKTENGIHLNTKALRQLESEYVNHKKQSINSDLQQLVVQYRSLTGEIENTYDAARLSELYSNRSLIQQKIEDTALLASEYEGLTSAYYKWEQAQSVGEEGDMYDSLASSLENVKQLYEEGLIGTNKFRTAVQLMSNQDLSNASIDELLSAYDTGYEKMTRYFAESSDGCLNFLHDVEELNSEWVHMNEDGSWNINFGFGDDTDVAEALGINVESVQSILRKLSDYGFDINLDSLYSSLDFLTNTAENLNQTLIQLGKTDIVFDFDTNDIDRIIEQIPKAQELFDSFKNNDGVVNLELSGADEAKGILLELISRKQQLDAPAVMSVDTSSADENISNCIKLLQDFVTNYNNLEIDTAVGLDTTTAQNNIQNIISSLDSIDEKTKLSLGLDAEISEQSIDDVYESVSKITPKMLVECGVNSDSVDEYNPDDKESVVVYDVDDTSVRNYNAPTKEGVVTYYARINDWTVPTRYGDIIYRQKLTGRANANGTALASGTASIGKAFVEGNWGTKESGTALSGELGRELVVRDGMYFTVGEHGAEFFKYKKNDIIFNAEQTEQILKRGKITSGNGRGKALASGTVSGKAFSNGFGTITGSGSVITVASGNGNNDSNSGSKDKDFKETFDWIETAIDRVERAIKKLDTKASSVYRTWSDRNKNLLSEMSKVSDEISIQQAGYSRYMQQANSVGLSSDWANKVKNGLIDINTITDETLSEKIKEFTSWYNKALDCSDAVVELEENLSDLYKTAFDNVSAQYDGILSVIQYKQNMIEEYISQSENNGYLVSVKYYEALSKQEQRNISELQNQKTKQLQKLNDAVTSGAIKKNSEEWYNMCSAIDDTTLAIEKGTTALSEYAKSIREIKWDIFELLQDKISAVTTEADFMIDLLSSNKMFSDNGQITSNGNSTMGLHAVNYNVYMSQSEQYAQEILRTNKQLAKDPYNEELAKHRQELIELQQDMIISAEKEKQAIVDMVRDGIDLELDSMQKLIDSYKDAIDSQKDMYNWQNKIKDQTSKVASLQKQLQSYDGDNSEETKATIQKLKVSLEQAQSDLEESQYDKYISDQKELLDELYLDYETSLNTRFDDIDALIVDMVESINDNSGTISDTIHEAAEKVGYTLSDSMNSIWSNSNDVVAVYGKNFLDKLTNTNDSLNSIKVGVDTIVANVNNAATSNISSQSSSTSSSYANSPSGSVNNSSILYGNIANSNTSNTQSNSGTKTNRQKYGVALAIINGGYGWGNGDVRKSRLKAKGFDANEIQSIVNRIIKEGYVISGNWQGRYEGIKELSPYHYNKFATGVHKLGYSQMAITQENGIEYINSPTQGMLTPLSKGADVFNAVASQNLWDVANNPARFIEDNLLSSLIPTTNNTHGNSYTGDMNIEINLEGVNNYEDFIYKFQHDTRFEKMIRSMTVDKMFGGSSLKKFKV